MSSRPASRNLRELGVNVDAISREKTGQYLKEKKPLPASDELKAFFESGEGLARVSLAVERAKRPVTPAGNGVQGPTVVPG